MTLSSPEGCYITILVIQGLQNMHKCKNLGESKNPQPCLKNINNKPPIKHGDFQVEQH